MQKYRYSPFNQTEQALGGRYMRYKTEPESPAMNTLTHGSYGALLFDPRWRVKRLEIIARDNECCVICKDNNDLLVHHRQYQFVKTANAFKMPWDYPDHLLITLCKSCHQRGHSKFKVPTLII